MVQSEIQLVQLHSVHHFIIIIIISVSHRSQHEYTLDSWLPHLTMQYTR